MFAKDYGNPIEEIVKEAIKANSKELASFMNEAISGMQKTDIREVIVTELRKKLAKLLIERFGGEIEKQVNVLKSDPTTRARIILAIENIVKETQC